ncbi:MAG: hypothetical protein HOP21_01815 [Methylotenera sp.]|nr:hypothetical protein [Methylotenera sp.]
MMSIQSKHTKCAYQPALLRMCNPYIKEASTQQGVVLFFALIALVVMSLAAVALIRSVDTNTLVAGNLSFKQATMAVSDRGVEFALDLMGDKSETEKEVNDVGVGYFASRTLPDNPKAKLDANGVDRPVDAQGNTVRYIAERMCPSVGPKGNPSSRPGGLEPCMFGPVATDPSEHSTCTYDTPCAGGLEYNVVYRVTARVTDRKNTTSYVQAFLY